MRHSFLALIPLLLAPVVRADEPAKAAIEKSLRRIEQGRPTTPRTGSASAAIIRRCRC
jgi:hypothetical protein